MQREKEIEKKAERERIACFSIKRGRLHFILSEQIVPIKNTRVGTLILKFLSTSPPILTSERLHNVDKPETHAELVDAIIECMLATSTVSYGQ